jgi:release factor glutamine methyltransferase
MSQLKKIQSKISESSDSPYLDGLVLLSHISHLSKSYLLSHPNVSLSPEQLNQLELALEQIRSGIPLPYVLGRWEFYQLAFNINPDVLIPRPETEGLVRRALEWLEVNPTRNKCLELGTGSGCISVTLAKNNPNLVLTASDISVKALDIARENSQLHQVDEKIHFIQTDLLDGIEGNYDLLIANLPYIPSQKLKTLKVFQTEPKAALDGGPDGLSYINKVLEDAAIILNPGSIILLELDEDCGRAALEIAHNIYSKSGVRLDKDLTGSDRYLIIQT